MSQTMTTEHRIRHDMTGEGYTDDEIEQTVDRFHEETAPEPKRLSNADRYTPTQLQDKWDRLGGLRMA